MHLANRFILVSILFLLPFLAKGQTESFICGRVTDTNHQPVRGVSIQIMSTNFSTLSNDSGYYKIKVEPDKNLGIRFFATGYQILEKRTRVKSGYTVVLDVNITLISHTIGEVVITNEQQRASGIETPNVENFRSLPNPSGNIESLIKTLPGVASSNELSSQYSVRGGNFDENLVYVNDIEIIRPFLIRSGQQEGLSFINPDLVSSVKFSAGGFEARYGDKMSSVLDVTYKKPSANQYSINASFLGASFAAEGAGKKINYIGGVRYKTSQYLLNSLDKKGEYSPAFVDFQSLVSYQPARKMEISFLGNFSQNKYNFIPESQSTSFGTITNIYNLRVYYDGKELDKYNAALGALTFHFKPQENLSLKLLSTLHSSYEQETFDIEGAYLLNELDNSTQSESFGDSIANIGVGSMFNHARNYLWINSFTISHIGSYIQRGHVIRWSAEMKKESIKDRLNEWTLIDSAGYSSPYSPSSIPLNDYAYARNNLSFFRWSGYLQDTYQFGSRTRWFLNYGFRLNYQTYNKELLISPRFRFSVKPAWKRDFMFFVTSGVYDQPPYYKEMRDFHGTIHPDVKAQQSIHLVLGSDYNLKIWNRPFKFTSEIYYKWLNKLIPYKIDNVRTRYTARNNAKGYATGIDLKLNGEFVPGIESWASLSWMKTEEDQLDDSYTYNNTVFYPGYYPRPTDQRIIFNLYFQDYLPNNPTLQMHLNLVYGSPVHLSPFRTNRFDMTFPLGPYRRVDMGFSKSLGKSLANKKPFFKEFIIGVEVFNLLNITNKASYLWVKTVGNQENIPNEFAVPNYLTSRRLNLKISAKF